MKGLLIKDMYGILQRKKFLALLLIMCIFLGFTMDGTFIIGYVSMIGILMSINSLNYDEYDNTLPFIMTMPSTRKQFAIEKYIFCYLTCLVFMILGLILFLINAKLTADTFIFIELIKTPLSFLPIILLLPAFIIPLQLKFGQEKQRLLLFIFAGIMVAVIPFIQNIGNERFQSFTLFCLNHSTLLGISGCILIAVIIISSIFCSIRIIEKKEF